MSIVVFEMQYRKNTLPEISNIECIPFDDSYFEEYKKIYNECFYEMRKALDIKPYDYLSDQDQLSDKKDSIFLLFADNEMIGSVACYGNEIDDLIVNKKFRHKGYGRQLLLWGMERIREINGEPITLHAAEWNKNAVELYRKVGFEITKIEEV